MALRIITDSAADLPRDIKEKYNLHVIPTPVVIEGKDYFDGETVMVEDFYNILTSGKEISTYHINADMFTNHFTKFAEAGDEVIYICFSTGLAGTYNSANIAKEDLLETYPDFDLTIIDSKCAALGFGLLVYYALRMQEEGKSKEEIIEGVLYNRDHMEHVFTVENLEYLFKGGRISKTAKTFGGMLNICPIIEVDDDGALNAIEKVRGRHKSLSRCVDIVGERNPDIANIIVGVCHGDDIESAKIVENMLKEKYGCTNFVESYVGCAIGAHTGPGVIGIVFLDEKTPYAL